MILTTAVYEFQLWLSKHIYIYIYRARKTLRSSCYNCNKMRDRTGKGDNLTVYWIAWYKTLSSILGYVQQSRADDIWNGLQDSKKGSTRFRSRISCWFSYILLCFYVLKAKIRSHCLAEHFSGREQYQQTTTKLQKEISKERIGADRELRPHISVFM